MKIGIGALSISHRYRSGIKEILRINRAIVVNKIGFDIPPDLRGPTSIANRDSIQEVRRKIVEVNLTIASGRIGLCEAVCV